MIMKKVSKALAVLVLILSTSMVVPATQIPYYGTVDVQAAQKLNVTKSTLIKGNTLTLKLSGVSSSKVKWTSSKSSVATVKKGLVTTKKKGTATITAKYKNKKYTCKVTVETPKISKTSTSIYIGNTTTLKMSGTTQKVKWSSSNKAVATISSKGIVTGKSAGTTSVTAKIGSNKYKCMVTVQRNTSNDTSNTNTNNTPTTSNTIVDQKVSDIILTSYTVSLTRGQATRIGATIFPVTITNKTVSWTSDNADIATVDSSGYITSIAVGNCNIIATCDGISAKCNVTVIGTPSDKSVLYYGTDSPYIINHGSSNPIVFGLSEVNTKITDNDDKNININTTFEIRNSITSKGTSIYVYYALMDYNQKVILSDRINREVNIGETINCSLNFQNLPYGKYYLLIDPYPYW